MNKLQNWNDWCNDKIVLTNEDDFQVLVNVNCIMHLQSQDYGTGIICTEGTRFDVKEDIPTILGMIGEVLDESKARKEAAQKAEEEARRAQYEAYAKATANDGKAKA